MDSVLMNLDHHIVSGSEKDGLVFIWDFVQSSAPIHKLDHQPGSSSNSIWGVLYPHNPEPVAELIVETAKSVNFMIHSVSAHPKQSKLLTSGGDFVWLWDAEPKDIE